MIGLILLGSLIVLAIGGITNLVLHWKSHDPRITTEEFVIASLVLLLIVIPLTTWIGFKVAFSNNVTYNEFRGGYEVQAVWEKIPRSRDDGRGHTWDCDPYEVYVPEQGHTDDKGNYHVDVPAHYETHYHDCPFVTQEWTFYIRTTLAMSILPRTICRRTPRTTATCLRKDTPGERPTTCLEASPCSGNAPRTVSTATNRDL